VLIKQSHNFDNVMSYLLKENLHIHPTTERNSWMNLFELHHIGFKRQTKKAINQFYFSGGKNRKGG